MELFRSEYVILYWDEKENWLFAQWLGYCTDEQIKTYAFKLLEMIKLKKANKYLVDNSEFLVMSKEAQNWLSDEFYPLTVAAGLKFRAVVMPKSAISRLVIKNVQKTINRLGTLTAQFDNLEEAKNWLRSQ
jgi:hypothetical protein